MRAMETEGRVGPLSYEVHAPEGETSAERPIVLGGLTAVGMLLVSLVAGWFLLGWIADARVVTRGLPLLLIVLSMAVAAYAGRRHVGHARRNSLPVVLGIALVAALFANRSLASIKPAVPQVQRSMDVLELPAGFRVLTESTHGDRFCHHGCPRVERRYAAPEADPDPVSTFVQAMFAQGWRPPSGVTPSQATIAFRGDLTAQLAEKAPHTVDVSVQRNS
jgi:hypothetical protein